MNESTKTLSPEEVHEILGCFDARWVVGKCRNEELRAFKLGGRWRITPQAVIEFLEDSENFDSVSSEFQDTIKHLKNL